MRTKTRNFTCPEIRPQGPVPKVGQSRRLQGGSHFKLSSKGKREQTNEGSISYECKSKADNIEEEQKSAGPGQQRDSLPDAGNPTIRVMGSPWDRSSRLTESPQKPLGLSLSQLLPLGSPAVSPWPLTFCGTFPPCPNCAV